MNKVFRYPYKTGYTAIIIIAAFYGLIFYGFFMDAYLSKNYIYFASILLIFCALYFYLFICLINYTTKLIVNNDSIIMKIPFSNQKVISWHEIKEFGRYKAAGPFVNKCNFYAKTVKYGNKKILLFSEMIVNGQELVDTIFSKAINAKFVVIRNISSIPFIKKKITENWEDAKNIR